MSRRKKNRRADKGRHAVSTAVDGTEFGGRASESFLDLDSKIEFKIAVAIIMLGVFLRFFSLDFQSLWRDELATIQPALSLSYLELATQRIDGPPPPLMHIYVKVWAAFFGTSDWALRASAAFAGSLMLLAGYFLAQRLFRRSFERLTFLALLATSQFLIYYSQEVRSYVLVALFAVWSTERFLAWWQKPSGANAGLYAIALAGIFYSHYLGMFIVPSHAAALFAAGIRGQTPWQRLIPNFKSPRLSQLWTSWAGVQVVTILLAAPRFSILFPGTKEIRDTFWMWAPNAQYTFKTLLMFGGYLLPPWGRYPIQWANILFAFILLVAGFVILLALLSKNDALRKPREYSDDQVAPSILWLCLTWLALGFGAIWAISYFTKLHIFISRTVIAALPGLLIFAVWLLGKINQPLLRVGLLALLLAPSLGTLPWYYTNFHEKSNWRPLVAYIDAHAIPGDKYVTDDRPIGYYTKRGQDIAPFRSEDLGVARRVWVVRDLTASDRTGLMALKQLKEAGYQPQDRQEFHALGLILMAK